MTDGSNIDDCTSKYFDDISATLPQSSDDLKLFLQTSQPRKFEISKSIFESFIKGSTWESAVLNCSNIVNDDLLCCSALEQMLINIISNFNKSMRSAVRECNDF